MFSVSANLLHCESVCSWQVSDFFLLAGETGPMVSTTLKLGISILNGGNSEVQRVCVPKTNPSHLQFATWSFFDCLIFYIFLFFCQKMLEYLKDKKDVGFFLSVQALMQTCWSVFNFPHLDGKITKYSVQMYCTSKLECIPSAVSWI